MVIRYLAIAVLAVGCGQESDDDDVQHIEVEDPADLVRQYDTVGACKDLTRQFYRCVDEHPEVDWWEGHNKEEELADCENDPEAPYDSSLSAKCAALHPESACDTWVRSEEGELVTDGEFIACMLHELETRCDEDPDFWQCG